MDLINKFLSTLCISNFVNLFYFFFYTFIMCIMNFVTSLMMHHLNIKHSIMFIFSLNFVFHSFFSAAIFRNYSMYLMNWCFEIRLCHNIAFFTRHCFYSISVLFLLRRHCFINIFFFNCFNRHALIHTM